MKTRHTTYQRHLPAKCKPCTMSSLKTADSQRSDVLESRRDTWLVGACTSFYVL